NGTAAQPGKVIDGRLEDPLVAAAKVPLVDAHPHLGELGRGNILPSDCGNRQAQHGRPRECRDYRRRAEGNTHGWSPDQFHNRAKLPNPFPREATSPAPGETASPRPPAPGPSRLSRRWTGPRTSGSPSCQTPRSATTSPVAGRTTGP